MTVPRVGDEVVEVMVAPHPSRPPVYGVIHEVCSDCGVAVVRCHNGYTERVPFDRFGKTRPQAQWRLTGGRSR